MADCEATSEGRGPWGQLLQARAAHDLGRLLAGLGQDVDGLLTLHGDSGLRLGLLQLADRRRTVVLPARAAVLPARAAVLCARAAVLCARAAVLPARATVLRVRARGLTYGFTRSGSQSLCECGAAARAAARDMHGVPAAQALGGRA